jgi:hypothetical protein
MYAIEQVIVNSSLSSDVSNDPIPSFIALFESEMRGAKDMIEARDFKIENLCFELELIGRGLYEYNRLIPKASLLDMT